MLQPGDVIDLQSTPPDAAPASPRLRILFIADAPRGHHISDLSVVQDYIEAFEKHSRHHVTTVNSRHDGDRGMPDFESFDAVLVHYSIYVNLPSYFPPGYWNALRRYRGLKVVTLQDEYRWGNEVNRHLEQLGVQMIVSSLGTENLGRLYRTPGVRRIVKCSALPGYISERMLSVAAPPIPARPVHVAYRGRENDYWLGRLARDKIDIAKGFLAHAPRHNLVCDISTDEAARVQGSEWVSLLCSARAALAVEGGASIFDFDGEAERRTREYLATRPAAPYEEVAEKVLRPFEGNLIHRTITPRCFEAICLKTALVMFPGTYRGILDPERHYIPLLPDFSNFDDVARRLNDVEYLQRLVDRAYSEIACVPDYRFSTFVQRLDGLISDLHSSATVANADEGIIRRILRSLTA